MSVSLINIATRNYTLYSSGISSSSHTMTLKFFWHPILIPKPRTLSVERSKATLIKSTASLCFSPTTYTLKFLEYSPFKTVNSPFLNARHVLELIFFFKYCHDILLLKIFTINNYSIYCEIFKESYRRKLFRNFLCGASHKKVFAKISFSYTVTGYP